MLPKIAALDGLRALAILLVMLRHGFYMFSVYAPRSPSQEWIAQNASFFLNGWIGVDLFFVLSGFLIARPFIGGEKPSLKSYTMKRALRIIPAYYAVLFLCIAGFFPGYAMGVPAHGLPLSILYHIVFLQDYLPANINVVFWSLGVEEKFYILAPILVGGLVIFYRKHPALCGAAIIVYLLLGMVLRVTTYMAHGMPETYTAFFYAARSPFHCCLDPLLVGVAIAFFENYQRRHGLDLQRTARIVFALSAIVLILLMGTSHLLGEIGLYDASFQPLLIACIMGGLVWSGTMGGAPQVMSIRPLRFIARISYGLYLVHLPLFPLSYYIAGQITGPEGPLAFIGTFMVIFLTISCGMATILYFIVERPFLKLKDRMK